MKRIMCLLMCMVLCAGCTGTAEEQTGPEHAEPHVSGKEETMKIAIDTQYGGFRLKFDMPENAVSAVLSACHGDHSPFENTTEVSTDYNAYILHDLCAYTAYANQWYEDMCIKVVWKDAQGNDINEGYSEPFAVTDYYPEEESREVSGRIPHVFSYHSESTMYMKSGTDLLDVCSVIFDDEETSFSAVYFDGSGQRREIERNLNETETASLRDFIEGGSLQRIVPSDPSVIMLDGSTPASFSCTFKDSDNAEERWYRFECEKSRQEELMAFLRSLCH